MFCAGTLPCARQFVDAHGTHGLFAAGAKVPGSTYARSIGTRSVFASIRAQLDATVMALEVRIARASTAGVIACTVDTLVLAVLQLACVTYKAR